MKIIAQESSAKKLLSFRSQEINTLLSITKEGWVENIIRNFQKGLGAAKKISIIEAKPLFGDCTEYIKAQILFSKSWPDFNIVNN